MFQVESLNDELTKGNFYFYFVEKIISDIFYLCIYLAREELNRFDHELQLVKKTILFLKNNNNNFKLKAIDERTLLQKHIESLINQVKNIINN